MTTLADINATLQDQNRTMEVQTRNITFLVDEIRGSRLDDLEKEREAKRDIEVATRGVKQSRGGSSGISLPGMGALGAIGGVAFGAVSSLLASATGILSKIPLLGPLLTPLIALGSFLVRKSPFILALMVIKDNWESIQKTWKNVQESQTFKWFSEQYDKIDIGGIVIGFFDYIRKGFTAVERLTAGDWKGFTENLDGLLVGLGTLAVITKTGRGLLSAAALAALSAAFGGPKDTTKSKTKPSGTRPPSGIGSALGAGAAAAGGGAAAAASKFKPNQFKAPISMVGESEPIKQASRKFPNFGKFAKIGAIGAVISLADIAMILNSNNSKENKITGVAGALGALVGAGGGALLGSLVGGPIGALIGAGAGAYGGDWAAKTLAGWLLSDKPEKVSSTSSGMVKTRSIDPKNSYMYSDIEGQPFKIPMSRARVTPPVQATAPAISMLASENAAASKQVVVVQDNSSKVVSNSTSQGLVMPSPSVFDTKDPNRFYPTRGFSY